MKRALLALLWLPLWPLRSAASRLNDWVLGEDDLGDYPERSNCGHSEVSKELRVQKPPSVTDGAGYDDI